MRLELKHKPSGEIAANMAAARLRITLFEAPRRTGERIENFGIQ
jgi:hypothetical protein